MLIGSLSGLPKSQGGYVWHEWEPYINSSRYRWLVWMYCRGHAGVQGNYPADRLASKAPVAGMVTIRAEWRLLRKYANVCWWMMQVHRSRLWAGVDRVLG